MLFCFYYSKIAWFVRFNHLQTTIFSMKALSHFVSSPSEAIKRLYAVRKEKFEPTLAVVFSSISVDYTGIVKALRAESIDVFGCTTAGEIANAEVQEQSAAIMFMDMPRAHYKLLSSEFEVSPGSLENAAAGLGSVIDKLFEKSFVLLNISGLGVDGEEAVRGLRKNAAKAEVLGGLAGDDFAMKTTYIFANDLITPKGIAALVLDKARFQTADMATSGWKAVGVEKTITKSEGNIVYEIDNEPAIDVFVKYFKLPQDISSEEIVLQIGVKFPLHLIRPDKSTVLRAPLLGNVENRSLIFAGSVPQGSKVRFAVAPDLDIVSQTIADLSTLKPNMPEADALLMYSCKARHATLGPLIEQEVAGSQEIWGNAPLVGFFSYGEFGTQKNSSLDFHNETCCLVAIKEITD